MSEIDDLRSRWTDLYRDRLPALAKARDACQAQWPVHLDHCFARIVLDEAMGADGPWTDVVRAPAVKNMTAAQLRAAVELAQHIAAGERSLVELNDRSLAKRGKRAKRKAAAGDDEVERAVKAPKLGEQARRSKASDGAISSYFAKADPASESTAKKSPAVKSTRTTTTTTGTKAASTPTDDEAPASSEIDMATQLQRIDASTALSPFRKHALRLLCQVPRGRYSTYQAMSDHISAVSHQTCARAVGSAMRNNPFAPAVPCHRILASDGSLGGFNGHWGEQGRFASEKHRLLFEEGVRFDSRGKVKGPPFRGFKD